MKGWDWLVEYDYSPTFVIRVLVKALILFVVINLLFVVFKPLPIINRLSIYNTIVPGRERLPYGEGSSDLNLSIHSLDAMFASHVITRAKSDSEFRVVVLGDSSVWGFLLDNDTTLTGYLNQKALHVGQRDVVVYNLGYPTMSVAKDLVLLDYAMRYEPDLIVWLVTLESFPITQQLAAPLLQHNAIHMRDLITRYDLALDINDRRFVEDHSFLSHTLIGQRRALVDWWWLQVYGIAYALTGIDQLYTDFTSRANDFETHQVWHGYDPDYPFTMNDLAFDVLEAGHKLAGDVPLLLVNEPVFSGDGANSDLHYNMWYPRWAYDNYRQMLAGLVDENGWNYLDIWNVVAAVEFTDNPVHLTSNGTYQISEMIAERISEVVGQR